MAKLKIYTFPDQVLAQRALPIERVEKALHGLADQMLETMYDAPGVGLAANQVGILQRIIVVDTEYDWIDEEDADKRLEGDVEVAGGIIRNRRPRIMINPEIVFTEGHQLYTEGCLSVPEYQAEVKRAGKIKIEYRDIDGLTQVLGAEGLLAVAIQHEIDHLDGKLFIDRLSPLKKDLAKKQLIRERNQPTLDPDDFFGRKNAPKKKSKGF